MGYSYMKGDWEGQEGLIFESCCVLMAALNGSVMQIHHRIQVDFR